MIIILLNIADFHRQITKIDDRSIILTKSRKIPHALPRTCEKSAKISQKIQFEYEKTF